MQAQAEFIERRIKISELCIQIAEKNNRVAWKLIHCSSKFLSLKYHCTVSKQKPAGCAIFQAAGRRIILSAGCLNEPDNFFNRVIKLASFHCFDKFLTIVISRFYRLQQFFICKFIFLDYEAITLFFERGGI